MNNYEFCADYAALRLPRGGKMLDYGCGAGHIVKLACAKGVDAYGCDVFYEGGDHSPEIDPAIDDAIFRMEGNRIPFPDSTFDLVTNNQVMEHVEDLDAVLAEIARVLKPGGLVLSLFPDRGVWREGHCGVPFLHRFPKGSSFRRYYAHLARLVGLGFHKNGKPPKVWADEFCQWLDDWTHYRPYREIARSYSEHLSVPSHIEAEWMTARLGNWADNLPASLRALVARKYAHMTFLATKSGQFDID